MDIRALLMGLAFAVMWSSAFTSARIIVAAAPPVSALALRFLISGLIGVLIARAMGQSWKLTPAQWRATIIKRRLPLFKKSVLLTLQANNCLAPA